MKYAHDSNDFDSFGLEPIDTAQGDRVSTSCAIDLRRCPRVDTWFKAQMISDYGKVDGFVSNLSRSGLCFEAGGELQDLFIAGNGQQQDVASAIVEICFELPAKNAESRPVLVQARAVYVIDGAEGKLKCGAQFRVFAEGVQALEDYLHARGAEK